MAAFGPGHLERRFRFAVLYILLREQEGEGPADRLVRRVAVELLRAGVPVAHASLAVQLAERDVLHPFGHDLEELAVLLEGGGQLLRTPRFPADGRCGD